MPYGHLNISINLLSFLISQPYSKAFSGTCIHDRKTEFVRWDFYLVHFAPFPHLSEGADRGVFGTTSTNTPVRGQPKNPYLAIMGWGEGYS